MSRTRRQETAVGNRRGRLLGGAALAAAALAVVLAGAMWLLPDRTDSSSPPEQPTRDDGPGAEQAAAPDVAFEDFDGRPAHLDDWNGELVVVNFWASWCPPCVAEMRDAFEPLHRELGDQVTFLGVNLQDTSEDAAEVLEQTGVTYELARDPDGALFTGFGGFGMPMTAFLDEDGTVVARHTGAVTRAELEALVRDHLLEG